jgi:hypothetical protein
MWMFIYTYLIHFLVLVDAAAGDDADNEDDHDYLIN